MTLRRSSGAVEALVYDYEAEVELITIRMHHGRALLKSPNTRYLGGGDEWDKKIRLLSKSSDVLGLLKFYKKEKDVDIFVEHGDLDEMLRAEAAAGEIRKYNVGDEEEDNELGEARGGSSSFRSMYMNFSNRSILDSGDGSSNESEGFVDEEYDMEDDDTLFDMNINQGVEEDGASFSHAQLFSSGVHDQLKEAEGEPDLAYDSNGIWSDKEDSDVEGDETKLDSYPKYISKTDGRQPKFAIGMFFSSRMELKASIDTYNIKDARDIKYVRNSKERVRVICKDESCKWFIYAKRLSGETSLQIRKWHLDHTCIPVYENKTLTSTWLAKHYVKKFRNCPNYKPVDFRKDMGLKLGQHVSRWQARRTKNTILKAIYGDGEEQFKRLWDFYTEVVNTNEGTKCYVKTIENEEGIDHRFYVRHVHENFKRAGFRGQTFKELLWNAATATTETRRL
ncbi:hypothetical protein LIER_23949 [Lithospermum erythrorhizon]|uniref:Transposase MuDR plant domain-containing protein n=1 Tax=Lithospermum erythrorhizon TaxID=34254 RepID=A0AAV3R1L0_LITER